MAREESLAEKREKEEHGAWKEGRSWRLKRESKQPGHLAGGRHPSSEGSTERPQVAEC